MSADAPERIIINPRGTGGMGLPPDVKAEWNGKPMVRSHLYVKAEVVADHLRKLTKWMEEMRASGDAGFWDWEEGDAYLDAVALLERLEGKA